MSWIACPLTASFFFAPILFCLLHWSQYIVWVCVCACVCLLFVVVALHFSYLPCYSVCSCCMHSLPLSNWQRKIFFKHRYIELYYMLQCTNVKTPMPADRCERERCTCVCVDVWVCWCKNALAIPPVHFISNRPLHIFSQQKIINIWAVIGYAKIWLWPKVQCLPLVHCVCDLKPQRIVFAISDQTNCFICPVATKRRIWLETQNVASPMNTLHLLASMDSYNSMVDYAINGKRQWLCLQGGWQCANERCAFTGICCCLFSLSLACSLSMCV